MFNWWIVSYKYLKKIIAVGVVLVIWQSCSVMGVVDPRFLPPFSEVLVKLVQLLVSGSLLNDAVASLLRAFVGFAVAMVMAIPLGILMGYSKQFEAVADPLLQICRNTTTLALYPVFILVFGLGELSKIGIIVWGSIWPMLINTIEGVKSTDELLLKAAQSMATPPVTLFHKVILPAAMPSIVAGIRISAGRAIIILVAAEMIGAQSGLGFLIFDARSKFAAPTMYAGILVLIVLGVTLNYLLVAFEKRVTRWKGAAEKI